MYVLAAHLLNGRTGEHRFMMSAEVVPGEEEAAVRAALLAQPENGHAEDWDVLSSHVEEVDRGVLEKAAQEVLGWSRPAREEASMQEQDQIRIEGVADHVAFESNDVRGDAREYERLGFKVEALDDDWALLRDGRGFGVALLAPGSKYPPHLALRVGSREALEEAARREHRTVREHRDHSLSFHTEGVGGHAIQVIYYPPEYSGKSSEAGP
jgi:hypothetical protein